MKVRSIRDVVLFAGGMTVITTAVVLAVTRLVYSTEVFLATIPWSLILVVVLTFTACFWGGLQMLKLYQLSRQLKSMVDKDRLSGAATRELLFREINQENPRSGVMLMVDIDHFKMINDAHGHLVGDKVIREVAQLLQSAVREDDIVCRFGGEEFVVFLNAADEAVGWRMAERVRQDVMSKAGAVIDVELSVTVSVGGAKKAVPQPLDDALRRADECLYVAKENGRNRSVVEWRDETNRRDRDAFREIA